MAYFFANQGSSIDILREQGYMFTTYLDRVDQPSSNMPALQNMEPGDTVIINVGGLIGIAKVTSKQEDYPMPADFVEATNKWESKHGDKGTPYWQVGMKGLRVNATFEPFNVPVRYQDHAPAILKAQSQSKPGRQPFATTGHANQETFYWLDLPLARVLMDIVGRPLPTIGGAMVEPTKHQEPGPYVAKFASREVRPEQSAFRDLMIRIWKKCPVTGIRNFALLDAAHFEDWRLHNGENAGMLLNPLIHRAVDREIIEIKLDPSGRRWRVKVIVRDDPALNQYHGMEFPNPPDLIANQKSTG